MISFSSTTLHQTNQGESKWNARTRRWLGLALLGVLLLILWFAGKVLLLFFSSVLLAILLRGVSCWLSQRASLSYGWALGVVVAVLLAGGALAGWLLAPQIQEQSLRLAQELDQALKNARQYLARFSWGERWLDSMPNAAQWSSQISGALGKATNLVSTTLGFIAEFLIFLFVGFYLAVNPALYVQGALRLIPPRRRDRAGEILEVLGTTMQRWLVGRFLLMAANAVVTGLGLWMMGIPLPFTLGIISGLLNFIPNIGPILAAIPAVLLGLMRGPDNALYVALFYLAYQNLDGFVLTPLVQRRTVSLPPAMTLMAQVLLGVLLGPMGVLLAVPITAMALVVVKMAYLEDVLGEEVRLPGQAQANG